MLICLELPELSVGRTSSERKDFPLNTAGEDKRAPGASQLPGTVPELAKPRRHVRHPQQSAADVSSTSGPRHMLLGDPKASTDVSEGAAQGYKR